MGPTINVYSFQWSAFTPQRLSFIPDQTHFIQHHSFTFFIFSSEAQPLHTLPLLALLAISSLPNINIMRKASLEERSFQKIVTVKNGFHLSEGDSYHS